MKLRDPSPVKKALSPMKKGSSPLKIISNTISVENSFEMANKAGRKSIYKTSREEEEHSYAHSRKIKISRDSSLENRASIEIPKIEVENVKIS